MLKQPINLFGKHVQLEALSQYHAHDLLLVGQDESIWKYMPIPPVRNLQDVQKMVANALDDMSQNNEFAFAIIDKATGKAVGSTRFYDVKEKDKALEIGWTGLQKNFGELQ